MLEGATRHGVDLEQFDVSSNKMLFVLPHQVYKLSRTNHSTDYFKIGFDEHCISILPKPYPFLINPVNTQKIRLSSTAAIRLN